MWGNGMKQIHELPDAEAPGAGSCFAVDDGLRTGKVDYQTLAKALLEMYASTSFGGDRQTVKDAVDALFEKVEHVSSTADALDEMYAIVQAMEQSTAANAQSASQSATQTGADRTATENAKTAAQAARDAAVTSESTASAAAQTSTQNANQTAADKTATGADRAAAELARQAAETAATNASNSAASASTSEASASTDADRAEAAAIRAEQAAEEAEEHASAVTSVNGHTGAVTLTKGDIGRGNVDNPSDADKPVSTATQTALDGKLDKSGGTMTGALAMGNNRITGLAEGVNPNDAVTKAQMEAAIAEGGGGTTIVQVPTVTVGNYTYNGTEQGPTIGTYDSNQVRVTGATNINAGTYTLTLSLVNVNKMVWNDLTTGDKTFTYTINKATPTFNLSTNAVTLNASGRSATATLTYDGDGEVSVSTSDDTVATASLSSGTVTIASVDDTTGTVTITVSAAEGTNYLAASGTIAVTTQFVTIYGASWDGTSTTAWTRTDAAAGFTDPVSAVSNGNGSSPFDTCMPWSGMQRVTDSEAGTLVAIPKFYYKWTRSGATMKLQIADGPVDGFLVSPAHADRGDGSGERDLVYVGAYHCSTNDYKSTTGVKPKASITRSTARSSIHNLGSKIWQWDYAMLWTIQMLYLVEYANWDSQAKIGYGCGNNSSTENAGACDAMSYHTGTNASSRTTYGHTRYRWIEDLWGNVLDWCDGIYFSGSNVYCIKNPSSFSDSSGGTLVGTRPTSSIYISAYTNPTVSGFEWALYPSAGSGSTSTYMCDYCYYSSSGVVLDASGYYAQGRHHGLFYLDGSLSASYSGDHIGSRLMKLP